MLSLRRGLSTALVRAWSLAAALQFLSPRGLSSPPPNQRLPPCPGNAGHWECGGGEGPAHRVGQAGTGVSR